MTKIPPQFLDEVLIKAASREDSLSRIIGDPSLSAENKVTLCIEAVKQSAPGPDFQQWLAKQRKLYNKK